jgi:putative ABC transport system permease protein
MLLSYLRTAIRNLVRHKVSSVINVVGLSIGISACLVIYLIVHYEFSFDTFHRDGDRIYRVVSKTEFPDMTFRNPGVPVPTAKAVREEVTGVADATFFVTAHETKVTVGGAGEESPRIFRNQGNIIYADTDYFKIFDYHWLAGTAGTALSEPFQVVLTESRAKLYFPTTPLSDVISRHLTYDDSITVTVSGVVEDLHQITDFTFCEFISLGTVERTGLKNRWGWDEWESINSSSQLFLKLMPGVPPKRIEEQLADVRNRHREGRGKKDDTQHFLQPLSDIHFNPQYGIFDNHAQAYKPALYGLLAVAIFLLSIGCINFINLATAQAAQRAKEIGIRKTLGSSKGDLMLQFLGESFLLTLLATVLSIAIAPLLLDIFRDFIPAGVTYASTFQTHVWIFLVLLILAVSVLSGLYPAMVLSRFQPASILRNQAFAGRSTTRGAWLRKTLTVAQFTIAQCLIIATIVVSKQVLFSLNTDLGYHRDAIVWFRVPSSLAHGQGNASSRQTDNRRFALLEKLQEIPEISRISLSEQPPASTSTSLRTMKVDNGGKVVETIVEMRYADTNYFNLYGIKLDAGRNLMPSDTAKEYVINETYARFLGFNRPEEALGHFIQRSFRAPIVGVLADFHTKSTHVAIKPLAYAAASDYCYTFHLALKPGDPSSWKRALDKAEKAYKEIYPDQDFDAKFFDETIAAFYRTEQNTARLLNWSAGLAILISCLGLLGLAIYTTNTRTKEIGVRKVLGASVAGIVSLLSKDFLSLVLVAFAVAAPVGWWAMHRWLEDFAYRTALSWWVFALAGFLAIVTAVLTVSVQAFRAASANPVDSLRNE